MAMKPITISFKNTEEDRALHEWITSHSNLSGFIKDLLRDVMNGEEPKEPKQTKSRGKEENELLDLGNF